MVHSVPVDVNAFVLVVAFKSDIMYHLAMEQNKEFIRFCDMVGGSEAVAAELGISVYTVSAYRRGRRKVPRDLAERIEKITDGDIDRAALVWPTPS